MRASYHFSCHVGATDTVAVSSMAAGEAPSSAPTGVVVPMPILPLPSTVKRGALVVLAMLKSGIEPSCWAVVEIASLPHGVEVPMPRLPQTFAFTNCDVEEA